MTKQIEGIPESISREDYLSWFAHCGFTPRSIASLKFTGKGVYAKVFELDENGAKIMAGGPDFGAVVHSVFIPVND